MKILVTGGCGYVGSVLVPYLAQRGYTLRVYDSFAFGNPLPTDLGIECLKGDIRDRVSLVSALEGISVVIHLAGIVTDELVDMNPALAQEINVTASDDLYGLAVRKGIRRFVYASSSSVYGSSVVNCTEDTRCHPETAYAHNKLDAERLLLEKWAGRGMIVTALRSATCCGPSPRMRLDTIVNVFSKQAMYDGQITVHGGTQVRSNIHVQDVARAYHALLVAPLNLVHREVFNATAGNATALDLATLVQEAYSDYCGIHVPIRIDATRQDSRHYRMDASKIRDVLGWQPAYFVGQAALDNWQYFRKGAIDPNSDLHYNNRRMKQFMGFAS